MGASSRPAFDRWVLGSAAERTVRSATVPVAVVPRREREQAWFAPGPAGEARPFKVLVGLEGHDVAEIVTFAAGLRRRAACDVAFLHFYWPVEEYQRLGLRGPRDPLAPDPEVVKDLEPKLRARVGALPGHGNVTVLVRPAWGDPAANLMLALDEGSYDMLIVGAHQRHGLARMLAGSVAERVARYAVAHADRLRPDDRCGTCGAGRSRAGGQASAHPHRAGADGPVRDRQRGDSPRLRASARDRRRRRALPRARVRPAVSGLRL